MARAGQGPQDGRDVADAWSGPGRVVEAAPADRKTRVTCEASALIHRMASGPTLRHMNDT